MIVAGCGSSGTPDKPDAEVGDGGGDQGTGGAGGESCGDTRCAAPATCTGKGASAKCECPAGYDDTNGDGTKCADIDECADAKLNDCDDHATCTNDKGGHTCKCDGPAYMGSGKACSCADGYETVSGECKATNSAACKGEGDCTSGHCVSGICCAQACDNPAACQLAKGATCKGGAKCVYPNAADDTACDDDDACTKSDTCQGGECASGADVCKDECADDPCDSNASCDDPSKAKTGDYVCTCETGYKGNGKPRNKLVCTDIDECADNPCGDNGTCTEGAPGTYACDCELGFTEVDGQCVCDLNGTFAIQIETTFKWEGLANIQDGLVDYSIKSKSWSIGSLSYDANGELTIETTACGAIPPDLCGIGVAADVVTPPLAAAIPPEAYGQYLPNHIWSLGTMPKSEATISLPNAIVGEPFVTEDSAVLLGIHLDDPLGDWPNSRAEIKAAAGDPNDGITNGAYWVNSDEGNAGDLEPGVTSFAVPPGGVSDDNSGFDDPPQNFGSTSTACPRYLPADTAPARLPYAYWPALEGNETDGFTVLRVSKFYTATRSRSHFDGSIMTCDRIEGAVKGPGTGDQLDQLTTDIRFFGCADTSDAACRDAVVDSFDGPAGGLRVDSAKFVIKRWTSSTAVTCDDVRGLPY